jgi:hypothetical protein
MAELKPCPFCGGEAKLSNNEVGRGVYDPETLAIIDTYSAEADTFWVECEECFAMSIGCNTEKEAIAAWERRAEDGE